MINTHFRPVRDGLDACSKSRRNSDRVNAHVHRIVARCIAVSAVSSALASLRTYGAVLRRRNNSVGSRRLTAVAGTNLSGVSRHTKLDGAAFTRLVHSVCFISRFSIESMVGGPGCHTLIALCSAKQSTDRAISLLGSLNVGIVSADLLSPAAVGLLPRRCDGLTRATPCLVTVTRGGVLSLGIRADAGRGPRSTQSSRGRCNLSIPPPRGRPVINIVSAQFSRATCFTS